MADLVKSILGGGWSLVVGWILPAVLNVLIFVYAVLPLLEKRNGFLDVSDDPLEDAAMILFLSVTLGLILAAIQTPIYRLLEGYMGWRPVDDGLWAKIKNPWAASLDWSHKRQLQHKQIMLGRLDLVELSALDLVGPLRDELKTRLDEVRADNRLVKYASADVKHGATQLAILRERVRRYPVSDQQVVPTRLGNAIRRLEEYGYDRFRLDSQLLWYELLAVAPVQAVKEVERSRIAVDFMVSLLAGHVLVSCLSLLAILGNWDKAVVLGVLAIILMILSWGWYRLAISLTDDWAAAVRSLVNLGRKPLIEALALQIPSHLAQEREMWAAISRLSARPFDALSSELDRHRLPGCSQSSVDGSDKGEAHA